MKNEYFYLIYKEKNNFKHMKILKKYDHFIDDRINEGIFDNISNIYNKLKDKLTGKITDIGLIFSFLFKEKTYLYNYIYLKKIGQLRNLEIEFNATSKEEIEKITKEVENAISYLGKIGAGSILKIKTYESKKTEVIDDYEFNMVGSSEPNLGLPYDEFGAEKIIGKALDSAGVPNYNHEQMEKEILRSYQSKQKTGKPTTLFIWGVSGIGKTETIKRVAKKLNMDCYVWLLSTAEPTDLKGAMVPDTEKERTVWYLPQIFPNKKDKNTKPAFIFLDELNRAPQDTINASLSLLLNHSIDTYELPSDWHVICAGNWAYDIDDNDTISSTEKKLKQSVKELDAAARTRLNHVNLAASARGILHHFKYDKNMLPQIIEFLTLNKNKIRETNDKTVTFPNPRNWEKASDALKALIEEYKEKGLGKIPKSEIVNTVGQTVTMSVARTFAEFLDLRSEIDVKNIHLVWTDPKNAPLIKNPNPNVMTALGNILVSISPIVNFDKNDEEGTVKYIRNLIEYIKRHIKPSDTGPEKFHALYNRIKERYKELSEFDMWSDFVSDASRIFKNNNKK